MKVKTYEVGSLSANCYIVSTEQSAVVIDPGFMIEKFLEQITQNKEKIKGILLTHGHIDHISAVMQVKELTGAPIAIHKADSKGLFDANISLCNMMNGMYVQPKVDKQPEILLEGGETLEFGDIEIKVIHTPGHTDSGVCFLIENLLFTGDTLFAGNIGRTDFPTGDYNKMKESLHKLAALDKDYFVYPGHGIPTTLEKEKSNNPYMVDNI